MEQPIMIIAACTLVGVIAMIILYLVIEKKMNAAREAELTELQAKIQENTNQLIDKYDALAKEVRTAQAQANANINSGLEQLQTENASITKDVAERITEIKTAFKDYSERVKETLNKYSNENAEFKKDSVRVKEQMEKELQNILKEIRSPLDLD